MKGSSRTQPDVKREVEPASSSSSEVADLKQRVQKLEEKLEKVIRFGGEHRAAALRAESKLDVKYEIVPKLKEGAESEKKRADDLEKRLDNVTNQLEEEKRKVSELTRQKMVLEKKLATQDGLQKRVDEGRSQPLQQQQPVAVRPPVDASSSSKEGKRRARQSRSVSKPAQTTEDGTSAKRQRTEESPEVHTRPTRSVRKPISYKEPEVDEDKIGGIEWFCDGAACSALRPPPPLSESTGHFKCWQCSDYDLCTNCKEKGEHSTMHHVLKEIIKKMKKK